MFEARFNLRFKFIAGLVLFAVTLGICMAVTMYFHFNSILESEISQRSRMLLDQSSAVQDYVKNVLRPEMFKTLPEGRFVLEAMSSSYISREIMSRMNIDASTEYHYRRVSMNPRNPDSKADAFEAGLINMFNSNRELEIWEDDADVGGKPYHMVARPVTFTGSCMQCHGDPVNAPEELIDTYGDRGGFHYTVGDVAGVVVAGFSVEMIRGPALDLTLQYLSLYILGILVFAGLISLFFDRLVVKNLHDLTDIFKTRFSGEQEQRILERLRRKDEIGGLIAGVDELALCLSNARTELEDYAQNLEKRVEERTIKLYTEAERHLSDVQLFVNILSGFSGMESAQQLISDVLEGVGKRFGAAQVVYYCTVSSENHYSWKKELPVRELDAEIRDILWMDDVLLQEHSLYIPVKSPESHWGVLAIEWMGTPDTQDLDPAILLAIGHQMAILIENIQSFSNIRLQNDILQSVFEGISDPLLLIDLNCHIIIANKGCGRIFQDMGMLAMESGLKRILSSESPGSELSILDLTIEKKLPVNEDIKTDDNRFLSVHLYPLPVQDIHMGMRIVVYIKDITHDREMLERMQQTERLSAIGKLAAGIAHEINNPLGVIQCYTDLVRDAVEDSETLDDIDIISKHTGSVKSIIQNLLNLSRPKQILTGRCSLNHVLQSLLNVFIAQGSSKKIEVVTELSENLPDIKCDAAILEQIITNLWLNAFDAVDSNSGKISLSTSALLGPSGVSFRIEDNGHGIKDEVLPYIFDPFFTTKIIGKGTGLGLSVVYGFVSELGGSISVTGNDGTVFEIIFPVAAEEEY